MTYLLDKTANDLHVARTHLRRATLRLEQGDNGSARGEIDAAQDAIFLADSTLLAIRNEKARLRDAMLVLSLYIGGEE